MRTPRTLAALLVALLALASLAACGDDAGDQAGEPADGGTSDDSTPMADGELVLQDVTGEVVMDAPAERLVKLEWAYAENAVAVGVDPVGVADVEGYATFLDPVAPLPEGTTDVGTRQEPSLEAIRALEPDLIVGVSGRHDAVLDELRAIAPTLLFDPYQEGITQLEEMRQTFTTEATALGRAEEAEEVLAGFDEQVEEAAAAFADLDEDQRRYALVQGYVSDDVPVIRMFTDDALVAQVYEEAGLVNAWTDPGDEYGFTTTDVEGMTQVSDAAVFVLAGEADLASAGLLDSSLFSDWQPVQDDTVFLFGRDTWPFGGPLATEAMLGHAEAALIDGTGRLEL